MHHSGQYNRLSCKSSEGKQIMYSQESKMVKRRLSTILLADALGSVTEACRRCGISRTQFYEYKRRYQSSGVEGLKDLPPVHRSHPQTTPDEVVKLILALSLKYPALGCGHLGDLLKLAGTSLSGPTIQRILAANNLGSKHQRLLMLEEMALGGSIELTAEQTETIERANPCFGERHLESSSPGELLCQDSMCVNYIKGIGRIYMQAVVDTYGSYAFATLQLDRSPEHAVAVLGDLVMPCFERWGLIVSTILTGSDSQYCGQGRHPFEAYLALNDIEHLTVKAGSPKNGFVEKFRRTFVDEFMQPSLRSGRNVSIESLQEELDAWLKRYNEEGAQGGYRNMGKCPNEMVIQYLGSVPKEGCQFAEEF